MSNVLLAIDQGTSSTRAFIFNGRGQILSWAQHPFKQYYPENGWVEHDPEEIWQSVCRVCRQAIDKAKLESKNIAAIGITNQRETTVVWDKTSHTPLMRAIVWQDRRTADHCQMLKKDNLEPLIQAKTGLVLDPYFSATKLSWILDQIPGARDKAQRGELAFGTIDSFLLWRFTEGRVHATDVSNASRTLLFNIHTQRWDPELLDHFNIPPAMLPQVVDSSGQLGLCAKKWLGHEIPITALIGDQQSATVGQACIAPSMGKATYGTGCFAMVNTGSKVVTSNHRLLSTVLYRIRGQTHYALEGSIFVAGAAVQWLRDGLKIIEHAEHTQEMAQSCSDSDGVIVVPSFTGLGAPHWEPEARGAIFGLTRNTTQAHMVRATLESVAFLTLDLCHAFEADFQMPLKHLKVDGNMTSNHWFVQNLADCLQLTIERPKVIETTAQGAAFLAGLGIGLFQELKDVNSFWSPDHTFTPKTPPEVIQKHYRRWQQAIEHVKGFKG